MNPRWILHRAFVSGCLDNGVMIFFSFACLWIIGRTIKTPGFYGLCYLPYHGVCTKIDMLLIPKNSGWGRGVHAICAIFKQLVQT